MNPKRYLRDRRHARLLTLARLGDGKAFRRLYHELYDPLQRYLGGRLNSPEDAEDLIGTVFFRFLEHLDDWDGRRGSVLAWLLTMARNALIDFYRAQKETVPVDELAEILSDSSADPLGELVRGEQAQFVLFLLQEFPPQTREMFSLRFGQDLRYREIAAQLGLTEDAVKQRFSRALRELRVRLEGRTEEGGEVDYVL